LGQSPNRQLAKLTYDPFVAEEQAENFGELLTHYQAPLTNGQDVFMEFTSGTYVSCNPPASHTPLSGMMILAPWCLPLSSESGLW